MKLLVITGVHGNESSLYEPLKKEFKSKINLILANPKAIKADKRYIDQDLNRSFNTKGSYESKLATKLKKFCKGYELVLDLHTHNSNEKFCLTANNKLKKFIAQLDVPYCIKIGKNLTNKKSLIENVNNSVSIEVGKHKTKSAKKSAIKIVKNAIEFLEGKKTQKKKKIYLKAIQFILNHENGKLKTKTTNFQPIKKGIIIAGNIKAKYEIIPVLVSKETKPGQTILMACRGVKNV